MAPVLLFPPCSAAAASGVPLPPFVTMLFEVLVLDDVGADADADPAVMPSGGDDTPVEVVETVVGVA